MANPSDQSFTGSLQGGFLLVNGGSVTGATVFLMQVSNGSNLVTCNSGTSAITGTISGSTVNLTAIVGTLDANGNPASQTFTLANGQLSSDNSTIQGGTYSSTAGYYVNPATNQLSSCGTAQSALQWSATSVPALTGVFQGNFHSTTNALGFRNQDFPVSGSLTQGPNIGASSATVTGTLIFKDPINQVNDYPCLTTASVNGEISGDSVVLQIFDTNGANVGQIGGIPNAPPVTFVSTQNGYVLSNPKNLGNSNNGTGYAVINGKCPGVSLLNPGDGGNVCLAFGNATACTQPITLSPISLVFPAQILASAPIIQSVTLTNTDPSGAPVPNLSLSFSELDSGEFYQSGGGDFNGLPNFTEQDNCAPSLGASFTLASQQGCTITISFAPQQSCPWLPYGSPPAGDAPVVCPSRLTGGLKVNVPPAMSADQDSSFLVPVSGTSLSALVPSIGQLDFGAEAVGESSLPQTLIFTNQSPSPVQILSAANSPCTYSLTPNELPRPLVNDGAVSGIQIARTDSNGTVVPLGTTVQYFCDADSITGQPNFQISSDACLGTILNPQQSCSLQITFVPQKGTNQNGTLGLGLDYYLELNTLQCTSTTTADCEIDSGRFPVELKTNPPSPLRMSPGAGLDFGFQAKGTTSTPPLTLTLYNDPNDPNSTTVTFAGKILQGADYLETDNCPVSLAPGSSCTFNVTFTPSVVGLDPGTIKLSYNNGQFQTIYLWGIGQ